MFPLRNKKNISELSLISLLIWSPELKSNNMMRNFVLIYYRNQIHHLMRSSATGIPILPSTSLMIILPGSKVIYLLLLMNVNMLEILFKIWTHNIITVIVLKMEQFGS